MIPASITMPMVSSRKPRASGDDPEEGEMTEEAVR